MTIIYLVRHGESIGNRHFMETGQNFVGAGELGTNLNEEGKRQIEETAEKLRGIKFAYVYSSDLFRANDSALILGKHFNLPVNTTAKLREHHREEETSEEGAKRLSNFLAEIENIHTGRKVLIVTHSALMRMFLISLGFAKNEEEFPGGSIENGGFVKLTVENKTFKIEETHKITKTTQP